MHFEFDGQGYVKTILYGCYTGSCIEYNGLVPSEPEAYEDMDDWADHAQTQAYYLNNQGNLTYDAEKAASLSQDDANPYKAIIDAIYPVGSIYMSVNDVNPETLFGGTWARIEDKFLLASGSIANVGDSGGAQEYSLSAVHKHVSPLGYNSQAIGGISVAGTTSSFGDGKAFKTANVDYSGTLTDNVDIYYTGNATVTATIPTMPPYLAVYVWQRMDDSSRDFYLNLVDSAGNTFIDANGNEVMVKVE